MLAFVIPLFVGKLSKLEKNCDFKSHTFFFQARLKLTTDFVLHKVTKSVTLKTI